MNLKKDEGEKMKDEGVTSCQLARIYLYTTSKKIIAQMVCFL
jgi:hypothetical protein